MLTGTTGGRKFCAVDVVPLEASLVGGLGVEDWLGAWEEGAAIAAAAKRRVEVMVVERILNEK